MKHQLRLAKMRRRPRGSWWMLPSLLRSSELNRRMLSSWKGRRETRRQGSCCQNKETGKHINVERSQELLATGADRIATACPFCFVMIDDGVKGEGVEESEVKVGDIALHLLEALQPKEDQTKPFKQTQSVLSRRPAFLHLRSGRLRLCWNACGRKNSNAELHLLW